jgi:DNA primase
LVDNALFRNKDLAEIGKKQKQDQKAFEIVKAENSNLAPEKIDILNILEKSILNSKI